MTNGTYDCVIHFMCGVGLRTAIWCGTPWSRCQYTNPHCT